MVLWNRRYIQNDLDAQNWNIFISFNDRNFTTAIQTEHAYINKNKSFSAYAIWWKYCHMTQKISWNAPFSFIVATVSALIVTSYAFQAKLIRLQEYFMAWLFSTQRNKTALLTLRQKKPKKMKWLCFFLCMHEIQEIDTDTNMNSNIWCRAIYVHIHVWIRWWRASYEQPMRNQNF